MSDSWKPVAIRWLIGLGAVLTIGCWAGAACWYYIYSADLPNPDELARLAPVEEAAVPDTCSSQVVQAIPVSAINNNVRKAIRVESPTWPDPTDIAGSIAFERILCGFPPADWKLVYRGKRFANRLMRRFTSDQLLAIYLNTYRFDIKTEGIEAVSKQTFSKPASALELDEAAYIFATADKGDPTSDVSLQRRDAYLDELAAKGLITAPEAKTLKARPGPAVFISHK